MKTNELKKGDWIILQGTEWRGEMWDNMKGQTRIVDVYGFEHEAGSVYSHDILCKIEGYDPEDMDVELLKDSSKNTKEVLTEGNFSLVSIEHTSTQLRLKKTVENMFGG